jgi:chromosome partitioning protein
MYIVVVGSIKGGVGKSTLATNFAVLRSKVSRLLLIDADSQKSTSDWVEQRQSLDIPTDWTTVQLGGVKLNQQVLKLAEHYDDIIIDVGGRDTTSLRSALSVADLFVIPFKPCSLDIWTFGQIKTLVSEMKAVNPKLNCLAVINQADSKGSDSEDAIEYLSSCEDIICSKNVIGRRKAFSNAAADGMGISELKALDKKALSELESVYNDIYSVSNVHI